MEIYWNWRGIYDCNIIEDKTVDYVLEGAERRVDKVFALSIFVPCA